MKLPKHGFSKTAQHGTRNGRLFASCPCCLEVESFRKDCGPHALRICHHQIFFLWVYIKDSAYRNNPRSWNELKTNITNIIADISPMMLQAMSVYMHRRARLCMQYDGAHFQFFRNKMYYEYLILKKLSHCLGFSFKSTRPALVHTIHWVLV
jgi:hypothetical protein